jgi:predicted flap endonuclease-1-like 5' DNA nuclease
MGLIDTIKSIFGLSSNDGRRSGDGDVTVEHEPTATAADASPSTGASDGDEDTAEATGPTEPSVDPEAGGAAESDVTIDEAEADRSAADETGADPVATDTDAAASTGSLTDDDVDAPAEAAETAEAHSPTEPSVDPEAGGAVESDVTIDEAETDRSAAGDAGADDAAESVETVRGIGPAYAERLANAGVATVGDLAAADAAALSEQIGVAESRIARWVDRARDRTAD